MECYTGVWYICWYYIPVYGVYDISHTNFVSIIAIFNFKKIKDEFENTVICPLVKEYILNPSKQLLWYCTVYPGINTVVFQFHQ